MILPTRTFAELVRDMSAMITASSKKLIDMSVGSVLRAIIESNAAVMLWSQWLILLTLRTTRAATSTGTDLDSWMADFSLLRRPATPARGTVTFYRYSAVSDVRISPGVHVKCADRNLVYSVVVASGVTTWMPDIDAYLLPAGIQSIDLPVIAATAGALGNVTANSITMLASPVPGIDVVNNPEALYDGADPETDEALRQRFGDFFAARSRATNDAISYAISQVSPNLKYIIQENVDSAGALRPGNIVIFVSSLSGLISSDSINAVAAAVEPVRPIGTILSVVPALSFDVHLSMTLTLPSNLEIITVQPAIRDSIISYVNSIPIGGMLSLTRISQVVYQADARIVNISAVTANSQESDLVAPAHTAFSLLDVNFLRHDV